LTLDFGYLITFVLTAYSTIATILPFLNTSENQNSDTFRFKALHTLLDKNSHNQLDDKLFAAQILDLDEPIPKNETCQKKQTDPNVCIAYAATNYKLNPTSPEIPKYLDQAQKVCKDTPGCAEKIWYLYRLLNLITSKPYTPRIGEDITCKDTGWKCTHEELNRTTHIISNLSQTGYTSIFSDNNANVLGLGRSLDAFISDLNTFIIFSFITGPVVFIVAIKTVSKYTITEKEEKKTNTLQTQK
jgi:hypothetical protein